MDAVDEIGIGRARIMAADDGPLRGHAQRLIRRRRYFTTRAEFLKWVGHLDGPTWAKWVECLRLELADEAERGGRDE